MSTLMTILNNGMSAQFLNVAVVDASSNQSTYVLTPGSSVTALPVEGSTVTITTVPPPPKGP